MQNIIADRPRPAWDGAAAPFPVLPTLRLPKVPDGPHRLADPAGWLWERDEHNVRLYHQLRADGSRSGVMSRLGNLLDIYPHVTVTR